ncbi:Mitogen-activated protein kinase kinase kinase 15 [Chionoecetes opilio]|uniref:Mitogen-activated protein kinase kinase kinase 15 n=1 Tax=Chionoecetes opilio TaxID=41210 RepID=A0A8J4YLB0_CHIOP|nr:Mitogen-activated protein kinase kinase kinase 15 [Chionoecetes opilio]
MASRNSSSFVLFVTLPLLFTSTFQSLNKTSTLRTALFAVIVGILAVSQNLSTSWTVAAALVATLLILEPSRMYQPSYYLPSYVTVNLGAEEKSLQLWNLCIEQMRGTCRQVHDWLFTASSIKSITWVSVSLVVVSPIMI